MTVKTFAPDEDGIYLLAPSFHTVAEDARGDLHLWKEFGALGDIDPAEAVRDRGLLRRLGHSH